MGEEAPLKPFEGEIVYAGSTWFSAPPVEFWQSPPVSWFVKKNGHRGRSLIFALLGVADGEGRGTHEGLINYMRHTSGGTRVQWARWRSIMKDLVLAKFIYCYGGEDQYWLLPGHPLIERNQYRKFSTVPLPSNLSLLHSSCTKVEFIAPYVQHLIDEIVLWAVKTHVYKRTRIPCQNPETLPIAELATLFPDQWQAKHGCKSLEELLEKIRKSSGDKFIHNNKGGDGLRAAPTFKKTGRKISD